MDVFRKAIQIAPFLPNDMAGELLRESAFTEDGFGCYSNFKLREGWEPINPQNLGLSDRTLLLGCYAKEASEVKRIDAFGHKTTKAWVCWHWDGDGTLLFRTRLDAWINDDCKKSYGWERNPTWHISCLTDDKYYA